MNKSEDICSSDIFVSGFLLMPVYYSQKATDQVHMFGYRRTQNVAALAAATLFISGARNPAKLNSCADEV